MADAKQVQIRRDTASNLDATTPVLAELAYDMTNKTLRVGDGVTAGGTYIPNADDIQTGAMVSGTVSGTANDVIVTLPIPLTGGYTTYTSIKFKAAFTNTGAMTLQVGAGSADDIKVLSENNLVDVPEGFISAGGIYEVIHNGNEWQLASGGSLGAGDMQSEVVNVTTATVTFNVDFTKYTSYDLSVSGGAAATLMSILVSTNGTTFTALGGTNAGFPQRCFTTVKINRPEISSGAVYYVGSAWHPSAAAQVVGGSANISGGISNLQVFNLLSGMRLILTPAGLR